MYTNFWKDFPFMEDRRNRVILANNFLKKETYKSTMQMIKE